MGPLESTTYYIFQATLAQRESEFSYSIQLYSEWPPKRDSLEFKMSVLALSGSPPLNLCSNSGEEVTYSNCFTWYEEFSVGSCWLNLCSNSEEVIQLFYMVRSSATQN